MSRRSVHGFHKIGREFAVSGVYAIVHTASGKRYIGSSTNIQQRMFLHLDKMRRGTHKNPDLMTDMRLFGESEFRLLLLEEAGEGKEAVEQRYIEAAREEGVALYNRQNAVYTPRKDEAENGKRSSAWSHRRVLPLSSEVAKARMSAGAKHSNKVRRMATVAAIVEAVSKLSDAGIENPTVRQIAGMAGVSSDTVYRWKKFAL